MSRRARSPRQPDEVGVRRRLVSAVRGTAGLLGALAMVVVAATAPSTSADWEDRGRTLVPVFAGDPAPDPTVVAPITDGANTVLLDEEHPENWAWTSRDTATGGRFPYPGPKDFCVDVVVNTETMEPSAWELELHLAEPPWDWRPPFTQSMLNSIFYDDNFSVTPAADYATSGLAYMRPDADEGEYASSDVAYKVSFCAETGSPAYLPPGPGTTYEIISVAVADSGGQAKITLVVKGYTWYFIGYTATFNLKTLLDEALASGEIDEAQYEAWLPTKVWYGPLASGATGDEYNVTVTPYNEYVTFINDQVSITLEVTGSQWGARA